MIRDLEYTHIPLAVTKSYWRFVVILEYDGLAVPVAGWRYWPKSGAIKPPMVKTGPVYTAVVRDFRKEVEARVRRRLMKALEEEGSKDNGEIARGGKPHSSPLPMPGGASKPPDAEVALSMDDAWLDDREGFMHRWPAKYRTRVLKEASSEDRRAFSALPADRRWTDATLDQLLGLVRSGTTTLDELRWRVDNGVMTGMDVLYILDRLQEHL